MAKVARGARVAAREGRRDHAIAVAQKHRRIALEHRNHGVRRPDPNRRQTIRRRRFSLALADDGADMARARPTKASDDELKRDAPRATKLDRTSEIVGAEARELATGVAQTISIAHAARGDGDAASGAMPERSRARQRGHCLAAS